MKNGEYEVILKSDIDVPVFCEPWYLDAFCGPDNWNYLLYIKNDELLGFMPYYKKRKYGLSYITTPEITLFLGPCLKESSNLSYYKQLSFQKEVYTELMKQIPNTVKFNYSLNHSVQYFSPFVWMGYSITPRVSFTIDTTQDLNKIHSDFNSSVKRQIKKASKKIRIETNQDVDAFISINKLSYQRQNLALPYAENNLREMHSKAKDKNCILLFAKDESSNIHATIFLLWDQKVLYYYLSGMNPEYKDSGAQCLLIYKAIEIAKEKGLNFNFYGSQIEGIQRFFRSFGSQQLVSYILSK